jgi:hypothetical protein
MAFSSGSHITMSSFQTKIVLIYAEQPHKLANNCFILSFGVAEVVFLNFNAFLIPGEDAVFIVLTSRFVSVRRHHGRAAGTRGLPSWDSFL